jgi:asparagine synthase (glutamine-hydrolysing)
VEELTSDAALTRSGVFDARAVLPLLLKCRTRPSTEGLSNTDNMAAVGVLSTQLLHDQLVARPPEIEPIAELRTLVER